MTFFKKGPISDAETGIDLLPAGQALERASSKGLCVSLLASGDGTEIIHHSLSEGSRWALVPEEGWDALESIFILSGTLKFKSGDKDISLKSGDFFSAHPVTKHSIFIAETDCQFLYVSSQPVFHHYSQLTSKLMELAVAVEEKDGYTADHCHRIRQYSMMVGEVMRMTSNELYELNFGALLHDIGKTRIPSHILGKPGKLTPVEWNIMKLHTVYGKQILVETGLPNLIRASSIVEQHHERFDGKGYPYGLSGDQICLGAHIVSVVDSYDAMTTDRVYQKSRSKEEAIEEIIRCRGTMYHPEIVDYFLRISENIR